MLYYLKSDVFDLDLDGFASSLTHFGVKRWLSHDLKCWKQNLSHGTFQSIHHDAIYSYQGNGCKRKESLCDQLPTFSRLNEQRPCGSSPLPAALYSSIPRSAGDRIANHETFETK